MAEKIQATFPNLKVVKSLNTISAPVMVDPRAVAGGDHTVFLSGNDGDAGLVTRLLKSFGWSDVLDLGDVGSARGGNVHGHVAPPVGRDPDRYAQREGGALR